MIEIDKIYFLDPRDRDRVEFHLCSTDGIAGILYRNHSTYLSISIPVTQIRTMADLMLRFNGPTYEDMLATLKATFIINDIITSNFLFNPINSGSFDSRTRHYSLFSNTFIVFHLINNGNNLPAIRVSIKDNNGWEVGSIK